MLCHFNVVTNTVTCSEKLPTTSTLARHIVMCVIERVEDVHESEVFKIFNTEEQSTWFDLSSLQYRPSCMTCVGYEALWRSVCWQRSGPLTYIFSSVMERKMLMCCLIRAFNRYMLLTVTLCSCLWHPLSSRISIHCMVVTTSAEVGSSPCSGGVRRSTSLAF